MSTLKPSITPTYDSRETGPRYSVTTWVGYRYLGEHQMDDPFVRHAVQIGWRDLLRGLFQRRFVVTVLVSADKELVDDVLELDANQLVPGRTRRAEFQRGMHSALGRFGVDSVFEDIVARNEDGQS